MWASRMVFAHDPETSTPPGSRPTRWESRGIGTQDAASAVTARGRCSVRPPGRHSTGASSWTRPEGFDSDFFAYLEDVDLAWRARWLGWMAWYVPEARVVHAHSATGIEESPTKTYYLGRNKS